MTFVYLAIVGIIATFARYGQSSSTSFLPQYRKDSLYEIPISKPILTPNQVIRLKYVRDSIPEIKSYPGGATTPTPKAISFKPGELLGDETGAFGIKSWLEGLGHQVVVTTDKEGPKSVFERESPVPKW